jgi:hypothetical protein
MPVTAIDFNGELYVRERQIDTEASDGEVWDGPFPDGFERVVHQALILRPERALIEFGDLVSVFVRLNFPTNSIMSGAGIGLSAIEVGSSVAIAYRGYGQSKVGQTPVDATPGHAEMFSYLVHGEILFCEEVQQFRAVEVNSFTHDRIVSVSSEPFNGLVYNLTVDKANSYLANGFASHNCECQVRPRLVDQAQFFDDIRAWSGGADNERLNTWYLGTYQRATA